jgi:hypothetical protein
MSPAVWLCCMCWPMSMVAPCRKNSVPIPGMAFDERRCLAKAADDQLKWFKQGQELFFKVCAVASQQRQYLLSYDELSMCTARLALHGQDAGKNAMRAQLYMHPAEVRPLQRSLPPVLIRGSANVFSAIESWPVNK